mmetsp:Transcript_1817/g.4293  ORF Transcript_1817/g.4293 Transcript_1817/m.4293 type:complete len:208 (-) Transcript_1817:58-681(-)
MRILPRGSLGIVIFLGTRIEQDVVVAHLVGFDIVKHFAAIGRKPKVGRVGGLVLRTVGLVRSFHFPRFDQILDRFFERSGRVAVGAFFQEVPIGERVIGNAVKHPHRKGIVHELAFRFFPSMFGLEFFQILFDLCQLVGIQALAGTIDAEWSLTMSLGQGGRGQGKDLFRLGKAALFDHALHRRGGGGGVAALFFLGGHFVDREVLL